jgi:DNA-binding transcriptional LysR family regulator
VRDLNDMYLFVQVAEHGGFSAASRALGIPKSRLSRRIVALEERLGTRLVQRSTRMFAVTAAGQLFLQHCLAMVAEADAADTAVAEIQSKPRGTVRVSCSVTMSQFLLGPILPPFLLANPEVRISVLSTNRTVNLIEENIDVALFVHRAPLQDSMLIERSLGVSKQVLVASPELLSRSPPLTEPKDLTEFPALSAGGRIGAHEWELISTSGYRTMVPIVPRLTAEHLSLLKDAVLVGAGIARLPLVMCAEEIRAGTLAVVLPDWSVPPHEIHAVYPSRKGMTTAVRHFIDYLVDTVGHNLQQG